MLFFVMHLFFLLEEVCLFLTENAVDETFSKYLLMNIKSLNESLSKNTDSPQICIWKKEYLVYSEQLSSYAPFPFDGETNYPSDPFI